MRFISQFCKFCNFYLAIAKAWTSSYLKTSPNIIWKFNQITIVIKGQNIFSSDDLHKEAVMVKVHPDWESSKGCILHLELINQPLVMVHVNQVICTRLESSKVSHLNIGDYINWK